MKEKSNGECILILKVETSELGLGNIIYFSRYGSLQKLLRITAYVKQFVRNVRSKKIEGEVVLKMLTADDIEEALKLWIIYEQAVLMKNGNFEKLKHSLDVVGRIKANIKQYCSNLRKRPNLLNYTFNSFLSMVDLGNSLLK